MNNITTVDDLQVIFNPKSKIEKIELKDKHARHQDLMLSHVQRKLLRQNSHKALITNFLNPRKLKSVRG